MAIAEKEGETIQLNRLSSLLAGPQKLDKVLVLFTFLNGILLQYVLASGLDFLDKVMASVFLLTLVFMSALSNDILNKMEEQRYDTILD